jgi:hypothetical protein
MRKWTLKVVGGVFREVESRLAVLSLNVFGMGMGCRRRQAEYQR